MKTARKAGNLTLLLYSFVVLAENGFFCANSRPSGHML